MRKLILSAASLAVAAVHRGDEFEEMARQAENIKPNVRVVTNGMIDTNGSAKAAIMHIKSLSFPDIRYNIIKRSSEQIKPWDRKHKKNKVRW